MADSPDPKSFFRGLLSAALIVFFTQAWLWYTENRSSEKALFDIKTELRENALLIGNIRQEMSNNERPTDADWLHAKRISDKLSRAAYERSRPSFDHSSSFHNTISDYYFHLTELQSRADDLYEKFESVSRQEEKYLKERDEQVQQLTNLALSTPSNQRDAAIFKLLEKRLNLTVKAVTQTAHFREQISEGGLKLFLNQVNLVELAGKGADASTDGLIAENHMHRILLMGILFLMPLVVFFAAILPPRSGNPKELGEKNNDLPNTNSD